MVNGPDNAIKCKNLGYAAPCGEHATCGGVEYIECKKTCGSSGGGSCAKGTHTASISCAWTGREPTYKCTAKIPCPVQKIEIWGKNNVGNDVLLYTFGVGGSNTDVILSADKIPGGTNRCYVYGRPEGGFGVDEKLTSSGVAGSSNGDHTWSCSYDVTVK